MTSRREVLKVGLAGAALPIAVPAAWATASSEAHVELYKVLHDTRYPASVAFASRARARGLETHAISGDMTRFWYDDLYYRWRNGPAAIAGLTAHGALFCLERLAWEQGMRVVFRGEHSLTDTGAVAHRFEGAAAELAENRCAAAARGWAAALADVVAACAPGRAATPTRAAVTANETVPLAAATLFSWVIAPVVRARGVRR